MTKYRNVNTKRKKSNGKQYKRQKNRYLSLVPGVLQVVLIQDGVCSLHFQLSISSPPLKSLHPSILLPQNLTRSSVLGLQGLRGIYTASSLIAPR